MLLYLVVIFGIYFVFLAVCLAGWQKVIRKRLPVSLSKDVFISVIIPFRDEEKNLPSLLTSLRLQNYPHNKFEIVLVNDHSQDEGAKFIKKWQEDNPNMHTLLLHATGDGKKNAIAEGVAAARGSVILTTDADCLLPIHWIAAMVNSFQEQTDLVIGLVKIDGNTTFFSKLQSIEFASLMGSGAALATLGYPVMCNGASLAYRKEAFESVNGYAGNLPIPSGDDEFLLNKFRVRNPYSIHIVCDHTAVVTSAPLPSIRAFIQQRLRWAGKWKWSQSVLSKSMATGVLLFQLTSLSSIAYIVISQSLAVGLLWIVKAALEFFFLFRVQKSLHQRFSIPAFITLQILYPVYVVVIGLLSQGIGYEWKGRRATR
jgi:biofilm PGA synthesis N-glycosyltransferase PgaC